jgi:hypothetical protein
VYVSWLGLVANWLRLVSLAKIKFSQAVFFTGLHNTSQQCQLQFEVSMLYKSNIND